MLIPCKHYITVNKLSLSLSQILQYSFGDVDAVVDVDVVVVVAVVDVRPRGLLWMVTTCLPNPCGGP